MDKLPPCIILALAKKALEDANICVSNLDQIYNITSVSSEFLFSKNDHLNIPQSKEQLEIVCLSPDESPKNTIRVRKSKGKYSKRLKSEERIKEEQEIKRKNFDLLVQSLPRDKMPFGKPQFGQRNVCMRPEPWTRHKIAGWYMAKKTRNMKCYWDGLSFCTKDGKKHNVPTHFTKDFPNSPLEGELMMNRPHSFGSFRKGTIPNDLDWENFTFIVHDAPAVEEPFKERLRLLQKYFESHKGLNIALLQYTKCETNVHINRLCEEVKFYGGEGLIFKHPQNMYVQGKTNKMVVWTNYLTEKATVLECKLRKDGSAYSVYVQSLTTREKFSISRGIQRWFPSKPPILGTVVHYKCSASSDKKKPQTPFICKVEPPPEIECKKEEGNS